MPSKATTKVLELYVTIFDRHALQTYPVPGTDACAKLGAMQPGSVQAKQACFACTVIPGSFTNQLKLHLLVPYVSPAMSNQSSKNTFFRCIILRQPTMVLPVHRTMQRMATNYATFIVKLSRY